MDDKILPIIKGKGLSQLSRLEAVLRVKPAVFFGSILFLSLLTAFIVTPRLDISEESYVYGDICFRDIKAPKNLVIVDHIATEQKRDEAANAVKPMFDYNSEASKVMVNKVKTAFSLLKDQVVAESTKTTNVSSVAKSYSQFNKILGTQIPSTIIKRLAGIFFSQNADYFPLFWHQLEGHMAGMIVQDAVKLQMKQYEEIVIRRVSNQKNIAEETLSDFGEIKTVKEVQEELFAALLAKDEAQKFDRREKIALRALVDLMINSNLVYNSIDTNLRRKEAGSQVKVLKFNIKKGEMIVRDGERITDRIQQTLKQINQAAEQTSGVFVFAGVAFFLFLVLGTILAYSQSQLTRFRIQNRDLVFLTSVLLLSTLLFSFWKYVAIIIFDKVQIIPLEAYFYLLPCAFGTMLVRTVLNPTISLVFSLLGGLLLGLIMDNSFYFTFYSFAGCLVGASGVAKSLKRSTLIIAGIKVGVCNVFFVVAITLITNSTKLFDFSFIFILSSSFLGGVLGGVLLTGLIPIFESVFGYVTDFQLMELSNMNHPIMKELIIHAPGTYAHSIMVGSLVEAAAEDIGANPLLCRVASYYHDIGKIKKPQYFVENQVGSNKHDKLSPRLSALIIIAHVKDGMEIAKTIGLPKPIRDIIPQHHGTSRIDYFYNKALLRAEEGEILNDSEFRYPGPKPQTREAGLVYLADMVQAASQSIAEKSPARLQGLIQKIINKAFTSGQLEECSLTLRDLHVVAKAFHRTFGGIYHHRIDYPEKITKGGEQKKMANLVTQSYLAEGNKPGQKKEDLRRLGQEVEKHNG